MPDRTAIIQSAGAVVLGLLCVVALGCDGADNSSREEAPPCCVTPAQTDRFAPMRIGEGALRDGLASAPDGQARALSDGILTFAEYEAAVLEMAACVRESPLKIEFAQLDREGAVIRTGGPSLDQRGRYQYSFFYPGSVPESEARIRFCRSEFLTSVENFWIVHVAPSEQDLAAARRALRACLGTSGAELPVEPAESDFDHLRNAPTREFRACSAAVAEEFALPGFSG
jgi:hypothetical protein